MTKAFKMIGISLLAILAILIIATTLFLNLSPQFGKAATPEQQETYRKSGHFEGTKFINESETVLDVSAIKFLKETIKGSPNRRPKKDISVEKIDSLTIVNNQQKTLLTWFGHSAFLLEIDGKKILIDPMLGESPAPHPALGTKRYSKELPIAIEKLPFIDAVFISHDHYDHLDYESIQKSKGKVGQYFTPLAVGNHLVSWGIPKENIHEMNWWEETNFQGLQLTCTPARHFSGRGLFDRSTTFWCSWIIKGEKENIFFSGDSGYDNHFKEIGEKYGPFDIALMECGQYNEDWKAIHMMPEETIQAALDVKSKLVLPIHWGAFTLALHDWTDPIERATKKAKEVNLPVATPKIGETFQITSTNYPQSQWWKHDNF